MPSLLGQESAEKQDSLRTITGGILVIASMVLVYFSLNEAIGFAKSLQQKNAGDVVAVLGAITTFLGSAVGLFFGINVGQAGKAQLGSAVQAATETAKSANETAKIAGSVAESAASNAKRSDAAVESAKAALFREQAEKTGLVARLQRLRARHDDTFSTLQSLTAKSSPDLHGQLKALVASPGPRPPRDEILQAIYEIVTNWLSPIIGVSADRIDTGNKLTAAPPAGIGLSTGGYYALCDACQEQTNEAYGTTITLTGDWRSAHINGTIDQFVSDVTDLVVSGGQHG